MEDIINEIVEEVKEKGQDWSKLLKIRYVYIELCKRLQRNTDFFLSLYNKLGSFNFSEEELKEIYDYKVFKKGSYYQVICKSAAIALVTILNKLLIKCKIIETEKFEQHDTFELHHFFVVASDDEYNYFLTPIPDFPNVQNNFKTQSFASYIPYETTTKYGTKTKYYKGPKIDHKELSEEEIRALDEKLGYIKSYYKKNEKSDWELLYDDFVIEILKSNFSTNKGYYKIKQEEIPFYKDLMLACIDKDYIMKKINKQVLECYDDNSVVFIEAEKLFKQISNGINNYEDLINYRKLVNYFLSSLSNDNATLYCEFLDDFTIFNLKNIKPNEIKNIIDIYINKYNINDKQINGISNNIIKEINNFCSTEDVTKDMLDRFKFRFDEKVHKLAAFIDSKISKKDRENDMINKKYESYVEYVTEKFRTLFPMIFDCNNGTTDFNTLGYSEQKNIMDRIIINIFNTSKSDFYFEGFEYNEYYPPIYNIINTFPIKSNENGEYSIIFIIENVINGKTVSFFYDLRKNKFKECGIIEFAYLIREKYTVASNRFKINKMTDIEKLENPLKK